jgi:hypothetical protein
MFAVSCFRFALILLLPPSSLHYDTSSCTPPSARSPVTSSSPVRGRVRYAALYRCRLRDAVQDGGEPLIRRHSEPGHEPFRALVWTSRVLRSTRSPDGGPCAPEANTRNSWRLAPHPAGKPRAGPRAMPHWLRRDRLPVRRRRRRASDGQAGACVARRWPGSVARL